MHRAGNLSKVFYLDGIFFKDSSQVLPFLWDN
jgi:hypothetical protein